MRLIVIGNGFDLNEGLDTSYLSFKTYLKRYNPNLFDTISFYYKSSHDNEPLNEEAIDFDKSILINTNNTLAIPQNDYLWGNLERNLANISFPFIRRYCGFGKYPIDSVKTISDLCSSFDYSLLALKKELKKWIRGIDTSTLFKRKFDGDNLFISFNYTDTLVNRYGVDNGSICYIHNNIESEELIFGCSAKELEEFNGFRFSHEVENDLSRGLMFVLEKHFKVAEEIMKNKLIPFLGNKNIEEVVVLGSSFSDVDLPYFMEINRIYKEASWIISYREDSKNRINRFAKSKNINYKLIDSIGNYLELITHNADI